MVLPRSVYRYYERRLAGSLPAENLPRHIGVILDGHRRFAREEGYADYRASYRAGMAKLEELLGWCAELNIGAVTAWVLSTENLRRPAEELEPYFEVLTELFGRFPALSARFGFSLAVSGSLDLLPSPLALAAKEAVDEAPGLGPFHVNIALCYGGRQEIVDACRALVGELVSRGTTSGELPDAIDAEGISNHLYAADLPDTDLVIRTSGEARVFLGSCCGSRPTQSSRLSTRTGPRSGELIFFGLCATTRVESAGSAHRHHASRAPVRRIDT